MRFFDAVRLALQTIRAQKLKSSFSIIGVLIGVMFLIAVVSVVEGMNRYMTDKFAGTLLGVNTFRVRRRAGRDSRHVDPGGRCVGVEHARGPDRRPPPGQGRAGHGRDGALLRYSRARDRGGPRVHRAGSRGRPSGPRAGPRPGGETVRGTGPARTGSEDLRHSLPRDR